MATLKYSLPMLALSCALLICTEVPVTFCLSQNDAPNVTNNEGVVCGENQFLCDGTKCKANSWKCDGLNDCLDGTDEYPCGAETTENTPKRLLQISSENATSDVVQELNVSTTTLVVTSPVVTSTTSTKSNESTTTATTTTKQDNCPENQFECNEGACIFESWVCDGFEDCSDGSDEQNCMKKTTASPLTTSSSTSSELNLTSLSTDLPSPTTPSTASFTPTSSTSQNVSSTTSTTTASPCAEDKFECNSGLCILKIWICDGDKDCSTGEDELNCPNITTTTIPRVINTTTTSTTTTTTTARTTTENPCEDNQYKCTSGQCIPRTRVCNRIQDCDDLSDETFCGFRLCTKNEAQCTRTRYCVFKSWICDNHNDCLDNSDEIGCDGCEGDEFRCSDGLCIKSTSRCDTLIDCLDGSDERFCSEFKDPESAECSGTQFKCVSDGLCVPIRQRCNGVQDCSDNSDETDCSLESCKADEFRCSLSGNCLLNQWVCDGYEDCFDGSDEQNCTNVRTSTMRPRTSTISERSILSPSMFCPPNFIDFEGLCLYVNSFPRKWLRAKEICHKENSELVRLPHDSQLLSRLLDFFKKRNLSGLNYWIGLPQGTSDDDFQEKEIPIPRWLLNGRKVHGSSFPMYVDNCYFLHFYDFEVFRSADCYDNAGFICELVENKIMT